MSTYETSVIQELIVEAVIKHYDFLWDKYKQHTKLSTEEFKELLTQDKSWKRTRKLALKANENSISTSISFRSGTIERTFDFNKSGILLKAFVYTDPTDTKVIDFKFIIFPSRAVISVTLS